MSETKSETKRFEDWEQVDCNECGRYWDSSCDGVKQGTNSDNATKGSQRLCNSFLPTRSVVIPEKLKRLQKAVKWLAISLLFTDFTLLIHLLTHLFGGYNG